MPKIIRPHGVRESCEFCRAHREYRMQGASQDMICLRPFICNENGIWTCWRYKGHSGPCAWCRTYGPAYSYIEDRNEDPQ